MYNDSTEAYTRALAAKARWMADNHPDQPTPDLLRHLADAIEHYLTTGEPTHE